MRYQQYGRTFTVEFLHLNGRFLPPKTVKIEMLDGDKLVSADVFNQYEESIAFSKGLEKEKERQWSGKEGPLVY